LAQLTRSIALGPIIIASAIVEPIGSATEGSHGVAASQRFRVSELPISAKPDNGLGGTSLHGLVFLLGQFNLGENRLNKLVDWFSSSYCLK